jgi:hypothetical protein
VLVCPVWAVRDDDDAWKSRTISGVDISPGDELMVEVERAGGERGRLDYVQLNYVGTSSAALNPRF